MEIWASLHVLNRTLEATPLLPFACAWVRRHHIPAAFRPVYYYVGIRTLLYFLDIFSRLAFRNNVYVYHTATVVLVCCLLRTYQHLLPRQYHVLIGGGLLLFLGVAVLDAALNGLFTNVNTYSQAFGCALLLLLALLHVLYLTRNASLERTLESQPEFFLSAAVLVYCSSSIVSYVAINTIYSAGYDEPTLIRLDTLITTPDMLLLTLHMALLAWMFQLFPLSVAPRRALPNWLHYSSRTSRRYRLLGRSLIGIRLPRPSRWSPV